MAHEWIWVHRYYCDVYRVHTTLLVCSQDALHGWLQKHFPQEFPGPLNLAVAKTIEITDVDTRISQWIIWFDNWKGSQADVLALVHETGHLTHQVLRHVGLHITVRYSEEAFTYLQESFVEEFWIALDRRRHGQTSRQVRRNRRHPPTVPTRRT